MSPLAHHLWEGIGESVERRIVARSSLLQSNREVTTPRAKRGMSRCFDKEQPAALFRGLS